MSAALAIFVKTPGHSPIKTRLAAGIGEAAAVTFHMRAARAVAEVAISTESDLRVFRAVAESAALDDALWADLPRLWQGEGGLGERLHRVHAALRERHDKVLLVGADAPQITPDHLRAALQTLDRANTPFVLGPAADGGFWLFGSRETVAASVWQGVAYSRADTARQLCRALGTHRVDHSLPVLADVDHEPDLATVAEVLASLPRLQPAQKDLLAWLRVQETSKHGRSSEFL